MVIQFWQDSAKKIVDPKIFSEKAAELSRTLASVGNRNKRTQIRRFYDEVLRLDQDAKRLGEDKWPEILARLHLLIPKGAYAQGRELVSKDFVDFLRGSVQQVRSREDLAVFANLFEAFMGFYRLDRPRD
ncbi:MAG: type III-A CRISPR-associated protein Csm2 [Desulfobacca sp.]|uniref:type III-A CRISPR-associated protein Csm2 n=1 Tax=Desulfobacca sp. TaxID=2067990 RepID=UPI00404A3879